MGLGANVISRSRVLHVSCLVDVAFLHRNIIAYILLALARNILFVRTRNHNQAAVLQAHRSA